MIRSDDENPVHVHVYGVIRISPRGLSPQKERVL